MGMKNHFLYEKFLKNEKITEPAEVLINVTQILNKVQR